MNELLQRIRNLTPEQRAELARQLGTPKAARDHIRLMAYVVPAADRMLDISQLRAALAERLPDYMLPHQIVSINALPLTPNGKVDREALLSSSTMVSEPSVGYIKPASEMEQTMADIWSEVLGQDMLGVHDNFFEIGGDSILSIQIVARARRAGIEFTPAQLFKHPTIADLANAIGQQQPEQITTEQGLVTGPVPLTPIQHWFFERHGQNPAQWNQAVLLRLDQPVGMQELREAVAAVLQHHDALRTRFVEDDGQWRQEQMGMPADLPLESVDLRGKPAAEQTVLVEQIATRHHQALRLDKADLLRVVHLRYSDTQEGLLILLHHLIVDGVSWRLLLEDLHAALERKGQAGSAALPLKTTSFQAWSQKLQTYSRLPQGASASRYWLAERFRKPQQLPRDIDGDIALNTNDSSLVIDQQLDQDETRALLEDVHAAYHTQINDILLTTLAQTMMEWLQESSVLFALEGHGREDLFEDANVTRTAGWFTSVFPVRLEYKGVDDPGQRLLSIKEQLRSIPDNGISYGLLKYSHEYGAHFADFPEPEIVFNYLGRRDQLLADLHRFKLESDAVGEARFPKGRRSYLIEVNCFIQNGCFHSLWSYSKHFHQADTIQRLAERYHQALRNIIEHCLSPQAGGHSLSDFPLADLDQDSFDQIAGLLDD